MQVINSLSLNRHTAIILTNGDLSPHYAGILLRSPVSHSPSWLWQTFWRHIGVRQPATTMLYFLRPQAMINGNPWVPLLLAGPSSHTDNALWMGSRRGFTSEARREMIMIPHTEIQLNNMSILRSPWVDGYRWKLYSDQCYSVMMSKSLDIGPSDVWNK